LPAWLACLAGWWRGCVALLVMAVAAAAWEAIQCRLSTACIMLLLPVLLHAWLHPLSRATPASHKVCPPPTPPHPPPQVGSVIRNPEVQALVPALLAAISKPADHTRACLDTLLKTTFINTIDAPSLALIVPVVHRGLKDRSGDTKKRAARIVGSMCSLINDPKVSARPAGLGGLWPAGCVAGACDLAVLVQPCAEPGQQQGHISGCSVVVP
jgi:hypothetical protein